MTQHNGMLDMTQRRHWPRLIEERAAPPPDPAATGDEWADWLLGRYFITRQHHALNTAIQQARAMSVGTERWWVGVNAPSMSGKSRMVQDWSLGYTDLMHKQHGKRLGPYEHIPVVCLRGNRANRGLGFYNSFLQHCGLPTGGNEALAESLVERAIDRHGIRVCAVDEAHEFRPGPSNHMADTLRNAVHLPVIWVFSGVALERSALLRPDPKGEDETVDQLANRMVPVPLDQLEFETEADVTHILRLVAKFQAAFLLRPGSTAPALDDSELLNQLVRACSGRLGWLLATLKTAGAAAHRGNSPLTEPHVRGHWPKPRLRSPAVA